jgi:hypothetical protein
VRLAYLTLAPQVRNHFIRYPTWHVETGILLLNNQLGGGGSRWWTDEVLVWIDGWVDTLATALLVGGVARGGIALLALLTAPLPAGLLVYHAYLIWVGMTTIERGKWSDWRKEVADGFAYVAPIAGNDESSRNTQHQWDEKSVWPKRSRQFLVLTSDGLRPRNLQPEIGAVVGEHAQWRLCRSLKEVDNTYNLGFWRNLRDVLVN